MSLRKTPRPVVSAGAARRALLHAQGILADPARRAAPAVIGRMIDRMGYVQIDTISIIERAHHHILRTRLDGYRPDMLDKLLAKDRKVFEHFTHDLCLIPTRWFRFWRPRFARNANRAPWDVPRVRELLGPGPEKMTEEVLRRIEREGPLMSRDFEGEFRTIGSDWGTFKVERFALQHLLDCGRVLVTRREGFQRVYDLAERVLPGPCAEPTPTADEVVDWACREALARLVVATPGEIRAFFKAVDLPSVKRWAKDAVVRGEVVEVEAASLEPDRPAAPAYALVDWERRAARAPAPPDRIRLLSPFDPIVRDRKRTRRLFGFEYRFEAFTPAKRRKYGYYVLPILDRDSLVGRLDAKLHRDRAHLEIKGLWWESGETLDRVRKPRLNDAVERFTRQIGGETWSM